MCSGMDNTILLVLSSLIRISTARRIFAPPRSFSQLVTSFFGAMYQGIHLNALCSLNFLSLNLAFFSLLWVFFLYSFQFFDFNSTNLFSYSSEASLFKIGNLFLRINLNQSSFFLKIAFCTCFFLLYAVVNLLFLSNISWIFLVSLAKRLNSSKPYGGLKWTRTIDLTLIRRVL